MSDLTPAEHDAIYQRRYSHSWVRCDRCQAVVKAEATWFCTGLVGGTVHVCIACLADSYGLGRREIDARLRDDGKE